MSELGAAANRLLAHEGEALLTRVRQAEPMAMSMPMVAAASPSPETRHAIDHYLGARRLAVERAIVAFLSWLGDAAPSDAQRQLTALRLRFTSWLSQYDLFADALTQRAERNVGAWLGGLDAAAADALAVRGFPGRVPLLCYLDRGAGAAIRRVSTPLPGGGVNPVSVIRIPRERMVGGSMAPSLVHEVGHQAAALLDLVGSLTPVVRAFQHTRSPAARRAWELWERWLGEVVADLWGVARVGVAATLGLIGVMSLPRPFVFRIDPGDPHPAPWLRVRFSCVLGHALYPHPQWAVLSRVWSALYPTAGLDQDTRGTLSALVDSMDALAALLLHHRPASLGGLALRNAFEPAARQPARLAELFQQWRADADLMDDAAPTLVFAVLGQARANGRLRPREESALLVRLLERWALRGALALSDPGRVTATPRRAMTRVA